MSANIIVALISCFLTGCSEGNLPNPPEGVVPAPTSPISCALELRPLGRSQAFVARISAAGAQGMTGKASLSVRSTGIEIDDRRSVLVGPNGEAEVQFSPLPLPGVGLNASLTVIDADGEIRCEAGS